MTGNELASEFDIEKRIAMLRRARTFHLAAIAASEEARNDGLEWVLKEVDALLAEGSLSQ